VSLSSSSTSEEEVEVKISLTNFLTETDIQNLYNGAISSFLDSSNDFNFFEEQETRVFVMFNHSLEERERVEIFNDHQMNSYL